MSHFKTIHLKHSFTETKLLGSGEVEIAMVGHTEGGKTHRVVLTGSLASIEHIADEFHKVVNEAADRVNATRKALRGEA